jgi:hypothetical protein
MSSPGSEPAHVPYVEQTSLPQVALFSHPPKAELLKQHHPLPAGHVDWLATPFSPTQRRSAASDEQAVPRVPGQPASRLQEGPPSRQPLLPNRLQTLPPAPPDVHVELSVPRESRQT